MESYKLLGSTAFVPISDPHNYMLEGLRDFLQPHPRAVLYSFNLPVQSTTPVIPMDGLISAIGVVRDEIADVRASLAKHHQLLEEILTAVRGSTPQIDVENVDDDEARARIQELFKGSESPLFYDEIAERLKLPLRQTVEMCNRLEAEGLIGERHS